MQWQHLASKLKVDLSRLSWRLSREALARPRERDPRRDPSALVVEALRRGSRKAPGTGSPEGSPRRGSCGESLSVELEESKAAGLENEMNLTMRRGQEEVE